MLQPQFCELCWFEFEWNASCTFSCTHMIDMHARRHEDMRTIRLTHTHVHSCTATHLHTHTALLYHEEIRTYRHTATQRDILEMQRCTRTHIPRDVPACRNAEMPYRHAHTHTDMHYSYARLQTPHICAGASTHIHRYTYTKIHTPNTSLYTYTYIVTTFIYRADSLILALQGQNLFGIYLTLRYDTLRYIPLICIPLRYIQLQQYLNTSTHPSIRPSVHPSIHPSTCMCIHICILYIQMVNTNHFGAGAPPTSEPILVVGFGCSLGVRFGF